MKHAAKSSVGILAVSLSFILLPVLSAQDSTGSVSGTVICNDGNTPGRGAKVTLIPLEGLLSQNAGAASKSTSSDFSGTYEIQSVSPGTYVVNATLDGYDDDLKLVLSILNTFTLEDKEKLFATFPQVIVKPGASVRKDLVLRRAAAISGHASVDIGGALERFRVTATRISGVAPPSSLIAGSKKSEPFSQSSLTDDRGAFRIAGLPAGKYRISLRITEAYFAVAKDKSGKVHLQPERPGTADLKIYAPEALDESHARVVEVNDGDEITDADITVPMQRLHSITGIVTQGGVPAAGIFITLMRKGTSMQSSDAVSMPDGSYRFDLVPSGSYILRARRGGSDSSGEVPVQLQDSDVFDANIDLRGQVNPRQ